MRSLEAQMVFAVQELQRVYRWVADRLPVRLEHCKTCPTVSGVCLSVCVCVCVCHTLARRVVCQRHEVSRYWVLLK